MTRARTIFAGLVVCVVAALTAGQPAQAGNTPEPTETEQPSSLSTSQAGATLTEPSDATPRSNSRRARGSRETHLSDRCRPIVEFAQLGDFDQSGLETLRRACG